MCIRKINLCNKQIGGTRLSHKKISFLFILLLLISLPVYADEAIIEENNLNVRSGPGTDNKRIGQVNQGEQYEIIEQQDEWVKIKLDDSEGWITKEFITIQASDPSSGNQTEKTIENQTHTSITIQHDGTHLRKGASTDYDIIGYAEKGQTFDVISETENWLEISDGETSGYIFRDHIESASEQPVGLKNKMIVIDPGHGGRDVGAIGVNGAFEKDITYLTAHELEKELTALGAEVILTRQEDEFIPLESRTALANAVETDAFISIHYNSFPEVPSVTGIESFYFHDQYEGLAAFIHKDMVKETDERDRGITFGDFHVIRQTFKPGVLLELGFISNEKSEALLETTGYQKKMVAGIISGLQKYFATDH